jgi:hypothetical protein
MHVDAAAACGVGTVHLPVDPCRPACATVASPSIAIHVGASACPETETQASAGQFATKARPVPQAVPQCPLFKLLVRFVGVLY